MLRRRSHSGRGMGRSIAFLETWKRDTVTRLMRRRLWFPGSRKGGLRVLVLRERLCSLRLESIITCSVQKTTKVTHEPRHHDVYGGSDRYGWHGLEEWLECVS